MIVYNVVQLTEILIYPKDQPVEDITNKLGQFIADGYEILTAIPFSNDQVRVAGIKYILRKAIITADPTIDKKSN